MMLRATFCFVLLAFSLSAQEVSLQTVVTPSTIIVKDGRPVSFAVHGFIEFRSLAEFFPYVEAQTKRWSLAPAERRELLRRGIESRVVSMLDERPMETLITHTASELRRAIAGVTEPIPEGYAEAFLAVQAKWKRSLNCWSAAPSIPARVLSNWYPIPEGIELYGARYDSVEHFWQAVKYHPEVTVADLDELLGRISRQDWTPLLVRLDSNRKLYLPNAYAVEFLRHNLVPDRIVWFRDELKGHGLKASDHVRQVQQRLSVFTAFEEKVVWGDLADLFHLLHTYLLPPESPIRQGLDARHFDAVYLDQVRRVGFISPEFRAMMLEAWKVKYLKIPRFGEVICAIPLEVRLEHFLNDGDSPDIPIPVYVRFLNQIRDLARSQKH